MCAHSCDPNCCWTYGDNDSFVLRARRSVGRNSELTISYLQDEDLLKSTDVRRNKLQNWKFDCGCERCLTPIDRCRGFRCTQCRTGANYYLENQLGPDGKTLVARATDCDVCGESLRGVDL